MDSDGTIDHAGSTNAPYGQRLGAAGLLSMSAFWFAMNLHWIALIQIILPKQVEQMTGAKQALWLSFITGSTALVALVVPPVVGALSDRCTSKLGRRRPYMFVGVVVNIAALALLWHAGEQRLIWYYFLGYVLVQLGSNVAVGAYNGVIPDVVPQSQRGMASGYMAVMVQLGMVTGSFSVGMLMAGNHAGSSYLLIALSLVAFLAITVLGTHESPLRDQPPPFRMRALLASMWVDPRKHPNFGWVWLTRFLFTFGMWMVQPFLLYYLRDVVHVSNEAAAAGYLMGVVLAVATITGVAGGAISDRIGRKPVVYAANGVMAACGVLFMMGHSFSYVLAVGVFYGLGLGAYTSVDWALGCDVLPRKEDAAKDMGVWHISMVLPQSLAPVLSGLILTAGGYTTATVGGQAVIRYGIAAYTWLFVIAGVFLVASALLLRNVKGVR